MPSSESPRARKRLPTGVAGLDLLLQGGIAAGSVFILEGPPGAGKTILANQICFHHARTGGSSLYVTLLAESHGRMLAHLGDMSFFDRAHVPSTVYYVSGFDILQREGLAGILQLLTRESNAQQASLIVLDGLFVLEETAGSEREFRKFVNDLENLAGLLGCTILLLTNTKPGDRVNPEHTMVDGWIQLDVRAVDHRAVRELQIRKYRGSDFLSGRHTFLISGAGVTVHPRLEALVTTPGAPVGGPPVPTGAAGLDAILGGGLSRGSLTLVLGATGLGKTTLGLHVGAAASREEPALFFSFYEDADSLAARGRALGVPVAERLADGALEVIWHPPSEALLDELGHELLTAVRRRGVKRLVIDGIDGFAHAASRPGRLSGFLAALASELRKLQVTTLCTAQTTAMMGGELRTSIDALDAVAASVVHLRYVDDGARLRRAVSLVKVAGPGYDSRVRELTIGPGGLRVGDPLLLRPQGGLVSSAAETALQERHDA